MHVLTRGANIVAAITLYAVLMPVPVAALEEPDTLDSIPGDDVEVTTRATATDTVPLDFASAGDSGGTVLSPVIETNASLVGMTWDGTAPTDLEIRSQDDAGVWSEWAELGPVDGAPDGAEMPAASEPIWVGTGTTAVQFRAGETVVGAEAVLIATLDATTAESVTAASVETTENGVAVNLRATWDDGCRNPDRTVGYSHVKIAVVHHTTGSNTYSASDVPALLRAICHYHVDSLGWDDIAYNFLVDRFGQVWEGRTGGIRLPIRGAHSQGFNTWSAGFALLGDHTSTQPSTAALDSLAKIVGWKLWLEGRPAIGETNVVSLGSALWSEGTEVTLNRISGHRNVQSTTCPGDYAYDDLASIRTAAAAEIASLPKTKATVAGDFNGDGRIDGATMDAAADWSVGLGSWNAIGDPTTWGSSSTAGGWETQLAGDFSGNGADDIAAYKPANGKWEVLTSDGSSFSRETWDTYAHPSGWSHHLVGDFNGDGKDDVASYKPQTGNINVALSTGSTFTSEIWASLSWPRGWTEHVVGDFNDDGMDDIASYKPQRRRWRVSISTGSGFTTTTWATFGVVQTWKHQRVGDFNGDGRDDIAQYAPSNGTWKVSISNGSKFTNTNWTNFTVDSGWARFVVADLTGDGLDDIAQYHPDDRRWVVSTSETDTFTRSEWADDAPKPTPDGDAGYLSLNGLEDFVLARPDGSWLGHKSSGSSLTVWVPSGE